MVENIREQYNSNFDESQFNRFIESMQKDSGQNLDFKVNESPLFLDVSLKKKLVNACDELVSQLQMPEFNSHNQSAIPENCFVPGEDEHPLFLQLDFGIVEKNGELTPQLIELQGFPSLYAYQAFLDQKNREFFDIPEGYTAYFNGHSFESYINLFRNILTGNEDPEECVLLEINPEKQKTRIDFYMTEKYTGVKTVNLFDLKSGGDKLFYNNNGTETEIKRIYNRVIFDELDNLPEKPQFDFHKEYDVKWLGHPNWFFRISKHTLPYFKSQYSPECYFLSDFDYKSEDLSQFVLKPLYSFAGSGVKIDITAEDLVNISKPQNYIVQRKVEYKPILKTPDGYSKAEIRMMMLWKDQPVLVNNLLRTSKGKMMGVDFNKGQNWIGSNIVYHPED